MTPVIVKIDPESSTTVVVKIDPESATTTAIMCTRAYMRMNESETGRVELVQ